MLRPWQAELRVGLCPGRLVLAAGVRPVESNPVTELARVAQGRKLSVVLSSHFVRYAVLPWSEALGSEEEWLAFARHTFSSVYGAAADSWHCRVSPAGREEPRLASAIDAALLESLRALPRVASVQPYLMSAFNARRRLLEGKDGWLVVQEPGRLTLALVKGGRWRAARTRRAGSDWPQRLAEFFDREGASSEGGGSEAVFLYGEDAPPAGLGRYRVADITAPKVPRALAMVCH